MKHAALLRGINVGGKNRVAMKDLAELFTKCGCRDVVTYIQSGNVVFTASEAVLKKIPPAISKAFGVPVVIRSHAELDAVIRRNPYPEVCGHPKLLSVAFLAGIPTAEAIAKLDPDRSPPDRFQVLGQEVYVHTPDGMANTKLTSAWMDSRLSTISTGRNWNTVIKLHEMTKPTT